MLRLLSPFKRSVGAFLTGFGIFWLPKDLQDYQDAVKPWQEVAAMVDQNTALWIFAVAMIAVIVWSDGHRFMKQRADERTKQGIKEFFESRTRFTIREAASIAVGVHPSGYGDSAAAQSEANEILYYARNALIMPAAMSERQHTALRQGRDDHGFDLEGVNLDTFITKDELASYMRPGRKSWLPVLDRLNTSRS